MIVTEIMHPCLTVTTTPLLAIFTRLFTKKSLVTRKNSPPARNYLLFFVLTLTCNLEVDEVAHDGRGADLALVHAVIRALKYFYTSSKYFYVT